MKKGDKHHGNSKWYMPLQVLVVMRNFEFIVYLYNREYSQNAWHQECDKQKIIPEFTVPLFGEYFPFYKCPCGNYNIAIW